MRPISIARVAATGFAIALLAVPALAAPQPAAPSSSAASVDDALHRETGGLVDTLGTQASVQGFVKVVRDRLVALLANSSGKSQTDVAQTVDTLILPDLQAHSSELRTSVIDIWASKFSVQEIRQLRSFYATSLGAKLVAAQNPIAQETQLAGRNWAEKYAKEATDKHMDELRSRGLVK